jgi:3-deoxy-D-manno-octulosonic-acid transferase
VRLPKVLYNLLLGILSPFLIVWYLWRVLVTKKSNKSWKWNLGGVPDYAHRPGSTKMVWIHGASVGEVVSSGPVQEALKRMLPDCIIVVTTITQTGNSMARKSPYADYVGYLPLDFPFIINRALDRMRPDVFVIIEAEFWPNLLASAKQRGIPCILMNGRVLDHSMKRLRWWGWMMTWALSNLEYCVMQTARDAERIKLMGARPEGVRVAGNTKFDEDNVSLSEEASEELRAALGLGESDRVLVAGSTNPGEERILLKAFSLIRDKFPDLRLIIAPRQIQRGEEIRVLSTESGFKSALRSSTESCQADWDVLILDSFGELARVYAMGQVAFVGGTLIPKGGHSLIQPILRGKPVLFGPYTFKTRDVAQIAISAGVGFVVSSAQSLADQACRLLGDDEERAEIREKCRVLVSENQGASVRCAELIASMVKRTPASASV